MCYIEKKANQEVNVLYNKVHFHFAFFSMYVIHYQSVKSFFKKKVYVACFEPNSKSTININNIDEH